MAEPFLGEVRMMSFNFPPRGWALCNGQLLPINQNQALFALFGTMYGGNGQTNFALPDLRGRVPIHVGNGHVQGERAGAATATLNIQQMPAHTHPLAASSSSGGNAVPSGRFLGGGNNVYHGPPGSTTLSPGTVTNTGGGQPHNNMQPYLTISFCVALQGLFPSPN